MLARYEINGSRRRNDASRHGTPPLLAEPNPSFLTVDSAWTVGGVKFPRHESSLPTTRRSSMASNVHSLLNPAETAERGDENDAMMIGDDRKRKRLH
jgi:hypothetical protein